MQRNGLSAGYRFSIGAQVEAVNDVEAEVPTMWTYHTSPGEA